MLHGHSTKAKCQSVGHPCPTINVVSTIKTLSGHESLYMDIVKLENEYQYFVFLIYIYKYYYKLLFFNFRVPVSEFFEIFLFPVAISVPMQHRRFT